MALVVGVLADRRGLLRAPTMTEAAGLAYLAIVVTGAFILWHAALPRLGPDRAGLFAGVIPVGGIVTTLALGLGRLAPADVIGATLVVIGLLIGLRAARGRRVDRDPALAAVPAAASAMQPGATPTDPRRSPAMARIGKTKIDGGWARRWYTKPEPAGRYLALATFELRSGWGLPRFEWYTLRVHRQLTRARGLIGYTFRGEFTTKYWTLSAWDTGRDLREFARHAAPAGDVRMNSIFSKS